MVSKIIIISNNLKNIILASIQNLKWQFRYSNIFKSYTYYVSLACLENK